MTSKRGLVLVPTVILFSALIGGIYGPRVIAGSGDDSEVQESLRRITTALRVAEQNYADPVDAQKAIYNGAIPGMLRSLDPHSNFFDPKAFAQLREDQRGRYYGVGMQVAPRNGKTIVMAPFVGSPAYKAGLRPGDVIIQVDDTPTDNLNTTQVAELLKGPRGTKVRILAAREGEDKPLEFNIVRDEIPRPSLEHAFMLTPDVGYIKIAQFTETTTDELRNKLREMNAQNLKGLVLDLRGNPGGLLNEGVGVAEMFLEKGQLIVSHRGRNSREKQYTAMRGNRSNNVPLVVLINRLTASAAEIVSGAIQDHDRGLIVGEPSFGKGLVQTVFPLSDNTGLALTTAKYYTPSGRLIQRDYSNISLWDYMYTPYFQKNNGAPNTSDMKTTDTGRTVYGGGGITPDVVIAPAKLNRFQQLLAQKYAFFDFAQRYLAQHKTISRDFEVTPAVVDQFRAFLKEKGVEFNDADFNDNLSYIRSQIQMQLTLVVFGSDEEYKLEAKEDAQVQKALELLPQAASMLQNTRRMQAERSAQRQDTAQIRQ